MKSIGLPISWPHSVYNIYSLLFIGIKITSARPTVLNIQEINWSISFLDYKSEKFGFKAYFLLREFRFHLQLWEKHFWDLNFALICLRPSSKEQSI